MSQWKLTNDAANSVNWAINQEHKASGKVARAANNTAMFNNTTPGTFVTNKVEGQFGMQAVARANTSGESSKAAHAGWIRRAAGMGPVTSLTVNASAASSGFVTGETGTLTGGGGYSGSFVCAANTTGNLASASITFGGTFAAASGVTVGFNREKYLSSITVGGTPTGYNNTDVITATAVNNFVSAVATVSTNSIGGFVSANVTVVGKGLFGNSQVAANITFTVANSTGGASAGSGATWTAVLANSSGGSLISPVLGGRAGRVHYETLVAFGSMTSGAGSNTSQLPIT